MNNREFDNILNECLERLLVRSETIEQCLQRYPGQAVELKPLLETALAARKASAVTPNPEFRARARYEFHAALQKMPARAVREAPAKRLFLPRWATAVAAVLVLLLGSGGTVAAASNSMPDEILYPVKLATEQVWLALTPSDIGKAELYVRLADRRVAEIATMVSTGKAEQLGEVTRRLDYDLGMVVILAGPRVSKAGGLEGEEGRTGSAPMLAATPTPVPMPTPTVTPTALPGPTAEAGQDRNAYALDDSWAGLETILGRDAVNNLAKLRALLETAPEQVKPALLQAIAVAEAGYQQALAAIASQ